MAKATHHPDEWGTCACGEFTGKLRALHGHRGAKARPGWTEKCLEEPTWLGTTPPPGFEAAAPTPPRAEPPPPPRETAAPAAIAEPVDAGRQPGGPASGQPFDLGEPSAETAFRAESPPAYPGGPDTVSFLMARIRELEAKVGGEDGGDVIGADGFATSRVGRGIDKVGPVPPGVAQLPPPPTITFSISCSPQVLDVWDYYRRGGYTGTVGEMLEATLLRHFRECMGMELAIRPALPAVPAGVTPPAWSPTVAA